MPGPIPEWNITHPKQTLIILRPAMKSIAPKLLNLLDLYLRRPLLITGGPGTGKSSLAYAITYELKLGRVLTWPLTSRSTLQEALYRYDALGRLQDTNLEQNSKSHAGTNDEASTQNHYQDGVRKPTNIGQYIRLGPLGTAFNR